MKNYLVIFAALLNVGSATAACEVESSKYEELKDLVARNHRLSNEARVELNVFKALESKGYIFSDKADVSVKVNASMVDYEYLQDQYQISSDIGPVQKAFEIGMEELDNRVIDRFVRKHVRIEFKNFLGDQVLLAESFATPWKFTHLMTTNLSSHAKIALNDVPNCR